MPGWGWNRETWELFSAGFESGLGTGALRLPRHYARLFKETGLRTTAKQMWDDILANPHVVGAWTGTVATTGALMMGVPMALGGAYDLITGRRRSRLAGFTNMATGVAIAGLPFYGPGLYRWIKPHATKFWNKLLR